MKYRFSLSTENAGIKPHSMSYFSLLGNGNFNIVTFFPTPSTPQLSSYPLTYIRPTKGSIVIKVIVKADSLHCTFTV